MLSPLFWQPQSPNPKHRPPSPWTHAANAPPPATCLTHPHTFPLDPCSAHLPSTIFAQCTCCPRERSAYFVLWNLPIFDWQATVTCDFSASDQKRFARSARITSNISILATLISQTTWNQFFPGKGEWRIGLKLKLQRSLRSIIRIF